MYAHEALSNSSPSPLEDRWREAPRWSGKGYAGRTIGLKLPFDNFKAVTRDRTLDAPPRDVGAVRRAAGESLKRVPLERRIPLLGVRVGA